MNENLLAGTPVDSVAKSGRRLLIVCQHFWPEQFRVNDIANFALERGVSVDVVCGLPNYPSGRLMDGYSYWNRRLEDYNGARVYRSFEIPRGSNSRLRIFLNFISFPVASLFRLPRLMRNRYDSVLVYSLSPVFMGLIGILLGKLKRIPVTTYVMDLWPENLYSVLPVRSPCLRFVLEKLSHWFYAESDRLVALSDLMKRKLDKVTAGRQRDVIVIPQVAEKAYETKVFDPLLRSRFKRTFNVVFQGNISPAQSFETIVGAAELVFKRGFRDVHWIIVGDGMSKSTTERLVQSRELNHVFSFEGQHPIEDMPKYADVADVLVGALVPSELLEATIPAKFYSYLAQGKPIVLAMNGEVAELVNQTIGCGFVSESGNVEALANNIIRIYELSPAERQAMADRAWNFHMKNFDRDECLDRLLNFVLR